MAKWRQLGLVGELEEGIMKNLGITRSHGGKVWLWIILFELVICSWKLVQTKEPTRKKCLHLYKFSCIHSMCVFYTCILSCVSISLSIDTYRLSRPCSTCFKAPWWSDSNHHSPSARYHPGLVVDVQFSHLGMHALPTLLPEGHVGLAMGRSWFPSKMDVKRRTRGYSPVKIWDEDEPAGVLKRKDLP